MADIINFNSFRIRKAIDVMHQEVNLPKPSPTDAARMAISINNLMRTALELRYENDCLKLEIERLKDELLKASVK